MNVLSVNFFLTALAVFSSCTALLQAGFVQGQVPEFVLGNGRWSETRSFNPGGIAVDPVSGKVFISDTAAHRILRFPASVTTNFTLPDVTEAEAVFGQSSFFGTGPGYFTTGLNTPLGLAFDPSGNLYAADSGNHRIVRYSNAANAPTGAAIDGALGQASLFGNAPGSGPASFNDPHSVTILGGFLAVADTGNHRVQVFHGFPNSFTGAVVSQSYGTGSAGRSATALNQPMGVAISSYGNIAAPRFRLWVADAGNNRVLRFDEIDGILVVDGRQYDKTADGVLGQADYTTDTRGNVPAANNMSAQSLLSPGSSLYIGDPVFGRVLRFNNAAAKANGAAADGVLGQSSMNATDPPVAGIGVALAGTRLWSAAGSGAARFNVPTTAGATWLPDSILKGPADVAGVNFPLMAEDRLLQKCYVYESGTVGSIRRYASCAAFRAGQPPEFTFSLILAPGIQAGPGLGGLAAHAGHLTLSDTAKHRVIDITNAALVTSSVPAQLKIIGQPNTSSVSPGTNDPGLTRMRFPSALCWGTSPGDNILSLYVADTGNHRVLGYLPDHLGIADIFGGADGVGGTSASRLNGPKGLAYDANSGYLYVADTGNNRLLQFRAFTPLSAAFVPPGPAVGVLGQADFSAFTPGSGTGKLNAPESLALIRSAAGNSSEVFVMDRGNNRVARFNYNNFIAPPPQLLINLTFNTLSPTDNTPYPYPSTRDLLISSVGSLMVEMGGQQDQRSLWITGSQRVTWFQRTYTPTILSVARPGTSFQMIFSKRPFFEYEILLASQLDSFTTSEAIYTFRDGSVTGILTEPPSGPRQFYRVREVSAAE
jgi:sugar lactone lactonase YvrE